MSSPCGKCDACPCSGYSKNQEQQQQKQAQQSGSSPSQQQQKLAKQPRVECRCVPNKDRKNAPVQAPLADTYTCLRPRNQPTKPGPPMCTCKQVPDPPQCECEPAPPPPPPSPSQPAPSRPPTHAYITCGTPTSNSYADPKSCPGAQPEPPRYELNEQKQYRAKCPHCDAPKKKKKCVIQ